MQTDAGSVPEETDSPEGVEAPESDAPTLTACETRPDRTVLLESGNTDGWIASDLTVSADEFR